LQKAYCDVQEQMVQELQIERQRLKALYKQQVLQQTAMQNIVNGTTARGELNGNSSSRTTPSVASVPGDRTGGATRSTRSTVVPSLDLTNMNNGEYISADSKLEMLFNSSKTAVGNASSTLLAGLPMGGRGSATRRKPTNVTTNGIPPLDQVLSESNMR
jgi:hypothetical protein